MPDRGENDEFVLPTAIRALGQAAALVADGDCILFMNFRSDRARELTRAFIEPGFDRFARRVVPRLTDFVMTSTRRYPHQLRLRGPESGQRPGRLSRVAGQDPAAYRRDRKVRPRDLFLQRRARGALCG